jgi:gluconate 2-dehydrogenase gamma chain
MKSITRRELIRATAVTGSAVLVSWFAPRARGTETDSPAPLLTEKNTFSYLGASEIVFVEAALGRLIPMDELGPGAKEANVGYFIDQQLAGPFGRAETWYMQGPWQPGTPEQGYQLKLTPAQLYRVSIKGVDDYCRQIYGDKSFADLDATTQDKVLHQLESGDIHSTDAPLKEFFSMLWDNAREGYFSDPMYGGNLNFAGWKLIGFPGPRYNYTNEIEQYGKPYAHPPVGLLGRHGMKPGKP